ncbi:MBL fold metallo-hydrolase [Geobacter sp. SVR]|uniref:ribonuclease Z n=1 Tax=Geobacter sp. SVR TaxID=2495594 RepID=UPI00143EF4B2|nr:MBL fold metallo-hydrolase [Geobacter sp. SVR]BCS53353.1 ribonuclease Z [Geobacter sp. SVR]GCF85521.1 ribonuclease Z [Geobacter sp. SVR]
MKLRLPFRYLEPAFFAGLLDDPLLFVRIRPLRRALLFDCGQIAHLSKRVVKPIDTVFITHAHMDHVMGIPTLVRHHHVSPRPLDIFGPPGIAERIDHQLRGYDWNLSEPGWVTIRVHEIRPEHILHYSFSGPHGFACRFEREEPRTGREIWSCPYAVVEAELLDHRLPVLAFRLTEKEAFAIDPDRLERLGLMPGEWIAELKKRVWKHRPQAEGSAPAGTMPASYEGGGNHTALYESIRKKRPAASLGYLCDVGRTPDNVAKIEGLLRDVTLLCADCTFLAEDEDRARVSYHLCTGDLNHLSGILRPCYLLPMHLSKSYLRRTEDIYRELAPPPDTTVLRLPAHIVPPPLTVEDVKGWLTVDHQTADRP